MWLINGQLYGHRSRVIGIESSLAGANMYCAQLGRIHPPLLSSHLMDIIFPADRPLRTRLSLIEREIRRISSSECESIRAAGSLRNFFFAKDCCSAKISTRLSMLPNSLISRSYVNYPVSHMQTNSNLVVR